MARLLLSPTAGEPGHPPAACTSIIVFILLAFIGVLGPIMTIDQVELRQRLSLVFASSFFELYNSNPNLFPWYQKVKRLHSLTVPRKASQAA